MLAEGQAEMPAGPGTRPEESIHGWLCPGGNAGWGHALGRQRPAKELLIG
jgi:hypothetical protein